MPEVYLMSDHVEDARAVIEAISNQPVVFVGLSRAAALGVNVAAHYPHLIQQLILLGGRPTSQHAPFPHQRGFRMETTARTSHPCWGV